MENPPELNIVEVTFTYDIPDAYLYQTNDLKKTATWTYLGYDKMWVYADKTTGKIVGKFHHHEGDNGADVPHPEHMYKIFIDANVNPLMASMFHSDYVYGELPHTEEALPDDTWYGHPDPIPPDHTYELTEIVWDPVAQDFVKPLPWKKPHVTWDDLKIWRTNQLANSDMIVRTCAPQDRAAWEVYRQKLRDLPKTFAGVDPWKVSFPVQPGAPLRKWTLGQDPKIHSREG